MLLGLSHLAFTTGDLMQSMATMQAMGFTTEWVIENLPNHPSKAKLLSTDCPEHHDLALMRSPNGLAIEAIHYPGVMITDCPNNAGYACVLPTPRKQSNIIDGNNVDGITAQPISDELTLHQSDLRKPGAPPCIVIPTDDLIPEQCFWAALLGISPVDQQEIRMPLRSVLPHGCCDLELRCGRQSPTMMLDHRGLSCLALLVKDLSATINQAAKWGGEVVSPGFTITINQHRFHIGLLRSPSGNILELLELL